MLASMVCISYWIMNLIVINYRTGAETDLDMAIAMVGVLIGIESARRLWKRFRHPLILMLLYGVYGYLAPDLHAGATFLELCQHLHKSDGVFGIRPMCLPPMSCSLSSLARFWKNAGPSVFSLTSHWLR